MPPMGLDRSKYPCPSVNASFFLYTANVCVFVTSVNTSIAETLGNYFDHLQY